MATKKRSTLVHSHLTTRPSARNQATRLMPALSCLMITVVVFCSCKKDDAPTIDQPCVICPIDFNVIDSEPSWSPDGRTIAYVHGDTLPDRNGIYLIDADGTNNRIMYIGVVGSPTWSPDGNWIAFSDRAQIFKVKTNGDSLTQLTSEGRNFFPAWSPDGEWIAYDSDSQSPNGMNFIWRMKADGSEKKRILYDLTKGEIRMPDWSPDGKRIVHQGYVGANAPEIVIMDTAGQNAARLTFDDRNDAYPKFSPDGESVLFTSQPTGEYPQIWIVSVNGTIRRQVTSTQGYTGDWSPDGEWIVYTDSRAINGRLWITRKDGRSKRQLTF